MLPLWDHVRQHAGTVGRAESFMLVDLPSCNGRLIPKKEMKMNATIRTVAPTMMALLPNLSTRMPVKARPKISPMYAPFATV